LDGYSILSHRLCVTPAIKQWDRDAFASDPWGRNLYGTPPQGRADYAFWQHILQSLAPKTGRCAILFPHGVLFRQEEADMRRQLIDADVIECVLGLGPNLFYNSPMEACVVICRTAKAKERRHNILFINAANEVTRERAQSFLTDEHIERIVKAYEAFTDEPRFARVVGLGEIRANDGNLSIPLYVSARNSNGQVQISANGSLPDSLSAWLSSATDVRAALATILGADALKGMRALGGKPAQTLPAWIKRDEWKRLPFGAFAQSINERVEPRQAGDETYVGLEHLDPQDLHIRRWGKGSDVIGTKLRFKKGDLIFGRRRAYQRKLAVADFDGICSAHSMVVRARPDIVLPEFLPFLMMSDHFMNRAVEISVGSLSPTINWTTLKLEEFALPPLDQQRRIAEILWAIDGTTEEYLAAVHACDNWTKAFVDERCLDEQFPRKPLDVALTAIVAGKSVVGVNEPATGDEYGVLKVSSVGPRGFDPAENKRLIRKEDFVPRFAVTAGDFLITRCNTKELVGRVCIVPESYPSLMLCDKTIKLEFAADKVFPGFMEAVLKSRALRIQIEARATGTGGAMKNISQADIRALVVPIPDLKKQRDLLEQLERGSVLKAGLESTAQVALSLRESLSNWMME
jgi:restriction endonuclease S subunit